MLYYPHALIYLSDDILRIMQSGRLTNLGKDYTTLVLQYHECALPQVKCDY
jgi:hypothetical protein